MILVPAIDIRDGRAVRLVRGDFAAETVYAEDPLDAARGWADAGARFLHVVDLDGARAGEPANLEHLRRIAEAVSVPVQYGGGLRSMAAVGRALAAGADRVVLGTAAFADPSFLDAALAEWGERVVVSIDVRGGRVSVAGWTEETGMGAEDVIEAMQLRGVGRFVYTSVDRDGTLEGPDPEEVRRVGGSIRGRFLYSGGIGSIDDLRALRELELESLVGVIAGKALYEGRFGVAEAQEVLG